MSNKRGAESEHPLDVPLLVNGDPTITWDPVFGKIGKINNSWYLNAYEKVFRIEEGEYIALQSYIRKTCPFGQPRGNYGKTHRYMIDGTLVESENVWFRSFEYNSAAGIAYEVEIKKEDDDKVHFVSAKNGEFVDRATYEREEAEYEQKLEDDKELLNEVKYWTPETCHESILLFRKVYAIKSSGWGGRSDLGICNCGMVPTERRVRKKSSPNCGKTFYGCSLFPRGCQYFEWKRDYRIIICGRICKDLQPTLRRRRNKSMVR